MNRIRITQYRSERKLKKPYYNKIKTQTPIQPDHNRKTNNPPFSEPAATIEHQNVPPRLSATIFPLKYSKGDSGSSHGHSTGQAVGVIIAGVGSQDVGVGTPHH